MSAVRTQLESARDIVTREYQSRRVVQLDTTGAWHHCSRLTCEVEQLKAHVCLEGDHVVEGQACPLHPYGPVVYVSDLYVCKRIGVIHACDRMTCRTQNGQCTISGLACAARCGHAAEVPSSNRRTRRRAHGVHTNEQSACILLYDLLFSCRRIEYETHRIDTALDAARRSTQRLIRNCMRDRKVLRYQQILDTYVATRQRLRDVGHITGGLTADGKQSVCRYYAAIFVKAWEVLSPKMPYRCSFECTAAAMLYGMRRGVACDGIMAIPRDSFLGTALPDAHAIAEVGIARRSLTQAKNALFAALQTCVHDEAFPVERFAAIFQAERVPELLGKYGVVPNAGG
jgi:hypothetical protein